MLERLFLVFLAVVCHCGCTSLGFNGTTPIHELHVALRIVRPYLSHKHKPSVQAHSAQALRKLPNAMDLPLALVSCQLCLGCVSCFLLVVLLLGKHVPYKHIKTPFLHIEDKSCTILCPTRHSGAQHSEASWALCCLPPHLLLPVVV